MTNDVLITIVKPIKAVAITAGTPSLIWTPSTGGRFVLLGFSLSSSAGASLMFEDWDGVTGFGSTYEFLRTPLLAALANINSVPNLIYMSSTNGFKLYLDTTVTTTVSGHVFGFEN